MTIRKNTPVPLYFQLAEQIREQIESAQIVAGDQLPSERDISERYGISRMTARQAITYLARHGHVVVRPGIGTFVAEPKLTHDTLHLLGFTEEMLRNGRSPSSTVLEQGVGIAPRSVAAQLGIAPDALTTRIVRLRLLEGVPLLLETVHVPQALAPHLEQEDFSRTSLYSVLEQHYGLSLQHARQTLEVTTARDDEAALLGIVPRASLVLLQGVTYTDGDQPVEAFKALYRGDKFSFTLESQRHQRVSRADLNRLGVVLR
jgi:GntR family transcriptional regulator